MLWALREPAGPEQSTRVGVWDLAFLPVSGVRMGVGFWSDLGPPGGSLCAWRGPSSLSLTNPLKGALPAAHGTWKGWCVSGLSTVQWDRAGEGRGKADPAPGAGAGREWARQGRGTCGRCLPTMASMLHGLCQSLELQKTVTGVRRFHW